MQLFVPSSPHQKINWYAEYNSTTATKSYRYPCTAQGTLTAIKVGLHGNRSGGADTYDTKLALEYPAGTITPMYFSGVRTATVPTQGKIYSDALTVPGGPIPHGTQFWIRGYVSGTRWPQHTNSSDLGIFFATGDLVDSGSITTLASANCPWPQEVLGSTGYERPVVVCIGDSYSTFESNGTAQALNTGPAQNAAFADAGLVGVYSWGEGASYAAGYLGGDIHSIHVQPILSNIDIVIVGFPWNDMHASDMQVSGLETTMTAIYNTFAGKEVWALPSAGPDTTGTWTDIAGQTRQTWWDLRRQFVNWLLATPPASVTRVLDVRRVLESRPGDATNGGYWNPYGTTDGAHPTPDGHAALKNLMWGVVQSANDRCLASAAKAGILSSTTLLGSAGTLSTAKVMQSAGGTLAPVDVLNRGTGALAGGITDITSDNIRSDGSISIGL